MRAVYWQSHALSSPPWESWSGGWVCIIFTQILFLGPCLQTISSIHWVEYNQECLKCSSIKETEMYLSALLAFKALEWTILLRLLRCYISHGCNEENMWDKEAQTATNCLRFKWKPHLRIRRASYSVKSKYKVITKSLWSGRRVCICMCVRALVKARDHLISVEVSRSKLFLLKFATLGQKFFPFL